MLYENLWILISWLPVDLNLQFSKDSFNMVRAKLSSSGIIWFGEQVKFSYDKYRLASHLPMDKFDFHSLHTPYDFCYFHNPNLDSYLFFFSIVIL